MSIFGDAENSPNQISSSLAPNKNSSSKNLGANKSLQNNQKV